MHMLRPDTIALTAVLALLVAFGPVATDMYVPSMPEIGHLLGAGAAEVQLTLSSYLIGFAIGQTFYGPISDRYGRKPVLLIALLIFCGASAACAGAPSIEWLIGARILQALGGSGAIVLARAIVRDLYTAERAGQELSKMGAIMSIAPVLAPLLGSLVQVAFGWRANFLAVLGVGLIATGIVRLCLPETLHLRPIGPLSPSAILHDYRTLLRDRSLLAYVGIVSTSYAGLFAWISASPFVLQSLYGLSPLEFGLAYGLACIGSVIGAGMAASLVIRIGLDRTIGLGAMALAGGGLGLVAVIGFGSPWAPALVLPMVIYHAGLGLAMPQAIAGALTPFPDHAGAASSLVGFVQQTSAALVGAMIGHALGTSAWPLAAAVAAMGAMTFALWAVWICADQTTDDRGPRTEAAGAASDYRSSVVCPLSTGRAPARFDANQSKTKALRQTFKIME
jgi:DHA1 family bicyclomycin/chloramphenicol resistance-like MFS transporter